MKRLYKFYTPEAINFAGGVPMDSIFPLREVNLNVDMTSNISLSVSNKDLHLNYLRGNGVEELKEWVTTHMKSIHANQGKSEFDICVTVGSTDALFKTLTMLSGNATLFDKYAYGSAVATSRSLGRTNIGVEMDGEGMLPDDLRKQVLLARKEGLDPDAVYLVPTAHNPTGVTMSTSRKEEIYKVCQDEQLLLIEDDAYYYLFHGSKTSLLDLVNTKKTKDCVEEVVDKLPGLKDLPTSLLSMDVDGRVIRFDSLSKFISPGFRLGWISCSDSAFISKYQLLQEISTQFPSGLCQSTFLAMVRSWGDDQFHRHIQKTQAHYLVQRNIMCSALGEAFTPSQCTFEIPDGGMFLWLKFPNKKNLSGEQVFKALAKHGIIVVPGEDFKVDGIGDNSQESEVTMRLSFAASSPDIISQGVSRLATGIKQVLDI